MGYKIVCFSCRKSFSEGRNQLHVPEVCQECGGQFIRYDHKFRPPKTNDTNSWKVVEFLYDHGFVYQHIYETIFRDKDGLPKGYQNFVKYPENMIDARDFVIKYKDQVRKPQNV